MPAPLRDAARHHRSSRGCSRLKLCAEVAPVGVGVFRALCIQFCATLAHNESIKSRELLSSVLTTRLPCVSIGLVPAYPALKSAVMKVHKVHSMKSKDLNPLGTACKKKLGTSSVADPAHRGRVIWRIKTIPEPINFICFSICRGCRVALRASERSSHSYPP